MRIGSAGGAVKCERLVAPLCEIHGECRAARDGQNCGAAARGAVAEEILEDVEDAVAIVVAEAIAKRAVARGPRGEAGDVESTLSLSNQL